MVILVQYTDSWDIQHQWSHPASLDPCLMINSRKLDGEVMGMLENLQEVESMAGREEAADL